KVPLLQTVHVSVELLAQAGGVMGLWEADGAGGFAHQIVLLDEPPIVKVPPLRAVEDEIEAGPRRFPGLVGRAAERFGQKNRVRVPPLDFSDEPAPELRRDLVGRVAPKALKPEAQEMFHHAEAIAVEPLRVALVVMVELGEVLP